MVKQTQSWIQKYGKVGRRSNPYFKGGALTNGKQVIANLSKRTKELAEKNDALALAIATKLAERAKTNLEYNFGSPVANKSYETKRFKENIYVHKYRNNSYRVAIRNNSEKPIMYLLEFGTGIVGKENPHDLAKEFGWEYAINEDDYIDFAEVKGESATKSYNSLKDQEKTGWIFFDEKQNKKVFTSGLYPISYMYDALQDIDEIAEEAKKEVELYVK